MDWSRAKTILIVAFLCLNVFLAYRLWTQPGYVEQPIGLVAPEELSEALEQLDARGVTVTVPVPRRTPALAALSVETRLPDVSRVLSRLFASDADVVTEHSADGSITWTRGNTRVVLGEQGDLVLERADLLPGQAPELKGRGVWDELTARQVAREFLDDYGFMQTDLRVDQVEYLAEDNGFLVTLLQEQFGWTIFDTPTEVLVGHWGISRITMHPIRIGAFHPERSRLVPATIALLNWAETVSPPPSGYIVTGLALGFIHSSETLAEPVWRITVEDGQQWYVHAVTGHVAAE